MEALASGWRRAACERREVQSSSGVVVARPGDWRSALVSQHHGGRDILLQLVGVSDSE